MMEAIGIAAAIVGGVSLVIGLLLGLAGRLFHVEVDERELAVRDALPGNNCGGCGFAGCDGLAKAIAEGKAAATACPVGGTETAAQIAAIMGVEAGATDRKVAFVRCKGTCDVTHNQGNYVGIRDCRSAVLAGLNIPECGYGCLGLGSCATVCPQDAIRVVDGVAMVNRKKCVGCGLCVKACPKGLIELVPESKRVIVQCSNKDRGPMVKKVCSAGCIGCMLCTKQCEYDAIHVKDNLASVTYEACVQCGKCVEKCPVKVITPPPAR